MSNQNEPKYVKIFYLRRNESKWKNTGLIWRDDETLADYLERVKAMFQCVKVKAEVVSG